MQLLILAIIFVSCEARLVTVRLFAHDHCYILG